MRMSEAVEKAVVRLNAILSAETEALEQGRLSELPSIVVRKNHSLLELSRLGRGVKSETEEPSLREKLTVLRAAIENNRRTLDLHVRASNEIAGLIAASITDAESDGTYGRQSRGVYNTTGAVR